VNGMEKVRGKKNECAMHSRFCLWTVENVPGVRFVNYTTPSDLRSAGK
jgi:hypothetical protein